MFQPTTRPFAYVYSQEGDMHLAAWRTPVVCDNCDRKGSYLVRDLGGNEGDFAYCGWCWRALERTENVYYLARGPR